MRRLLTPIVWVRRMWRYWRLERAIAKYCRGHARMQEEYDKAQARMRAEYDKAAERY